MAKKNVGGMVIDAVTSDHCRLPAQYRHLLMTMAWVANRVTGEGWSSQETLARKMGCSPRKVRELLSELESDPKIRNASPVRVTRVRRMIGLLRTSDLYKLEPTEPAGSAATEPEESAASVVRPKRQKTPPVPAGSAAAVPANSAGDPGSDPGSSDPGSISASQNEAGQLTLVEEPDPPNAKTGKVKATGKAKGASKGSKGKRKAEPPTPEQAAAHKHVTETYFAEFERARGVKPTFDGAEGTAVKNLLRKCNGDADRACSAVRNAYANEFWKTQATIRSIARDPSKFLGTVNRTPTNGQKAAEQRINGLFERARRLKAEEQAQ